MAGLSAVPLRASCTGAESALATVQSTLREGRFEEAPKLLRALSESHPDCVPALTLRAQYAAASGDSAVAERLFARACELSPGQPEPLFRLGMFYDSRQQHGRAAEQFRKVLALAPSDPQAYDYLALSLEGQGEFTKAEAAYRMGLARNKGPRFDPMLHYNYGRYLVKQGRLNDARQHLDEAVRLVPGVRAVQYERAKLAELVGDDRAARELAERALELEDRQGVILDMQVHYLLSRIYRKLGEKALAAKFTALSQQGEIPLDARRRSGR